MALMQLEETLQAKQKQMLAWRSNVASAVMSASGQGRAEVCLGAN